MTRVPIIIIGTPVIIDYSFKHKIRFYAEVIIHKGNFENWRHLFKKAHNKTLYQRKCIFVNIYSENNLKRCFCCHN